MLTQPQLLLLRQHQEDQLPEEEGEGVGEEEGVLLLSCPIAQHGRSSRGPAHQNLPLPQLLPNLASIIWPLLALPKSEI